MLSSRTLRLALLAALLALAGCGCSREEPAQGSDVEGAGPEGSNGAPSRPRDPDRVAPTAGEPVVGGTIELTGALASATDGALILTARDAGTNMPALARKYDLAQHGYRPGEPFEFVLTDGDMTLPVPVPQAILLKITYDPDGLQDTREGAVTVVLDVRAGEMQVRARLGGPAEQDG